MDELLSKIQQACEGMMVEEIQAAIEQSAIAGSVPDSGALATYFASLGSAE